MQGEEGGPLGTKKIDLKRYFNWLKPTTTNTDNEAEELTAKQCHVQEKQIQARP